MKQLTAKQQRFVEEYLVDLNATQAAIRAGYSPKTAQEQSSDMLSKPIIADAVAAARKKLSEKTEITQERVLAEYAKLAFYDPRKLFDDDGRPIDISKLDDSTAAAVSGFEALAVNEGEARVTKVKLSDKRAALDSIAKHLGMFKDRVEITGEGGGPVAVASTINISGLSDAALRELVALADRSSDEQKTD